jgi:CHAP domain
MTEPVPPFGSPAPLRPEDGPQDVSQEPGGVADLARLLAFPEPPGAAAMLNMARSQLGTLARSSGWTPYGQWYADHIAHDQAFATADFCDMFISWCADRTHLGSVVGERAFCPWHARWFYDAGHWGHTPRPGAPVFFNWKGQLGSPDDAEHVGLLESTRSDGRIVTIEANTRKDGTGPIGVWRRVRDPQGIVIGYGYPPYPSAPTPTPATADEDCWVI